MLALDEVIIYKTTLNQVFMDNFMIFIQIHHVIVPYFARTTYYLSFSHVACCAAASKNTYTLLK
jgi:hypothetical protein